MSDVVSLEGLSLPVVRPDTVAGVGDEVRRAAAVYPVGGRTQLAMGLPPTIPGVALDLTALNAVIDYPARDMTITVQAGLRVANLRAILAGEKQRLPIDVPRDDDATIGGAVAGNLSGPRRYGAGTLRDYVIGISTVGGDGVETKAGGRVVKNVAGYDLCKLHTGAFGTLGVITQLTLKVRPVPESQALAKVGCEGAELGRLLDVLHATRTRPICLEALNRPAAELAGLAAGPDWTVAVGFEDSQQAVEWQLQQLIKELTAAGFGGMQARAGAACEPLWRSLTELPTGEGADLTFKVNLLPGEVAGFCQAAPAGLRLHAHAGSGIVWGHAGPGLTEASAREMVKSLAPPRGNLIVTRCPPAWKPSLPVWGSPRGDLGLMRRVKAALDPRGVFNPGRLF